MPRKYPRRDPFGTRIPRQERNPPPFVGPLEEWGGPNLEDPPITGYWDWGEPSYDTRTQEQMDREDFLRKMFDEQLERMPIREPGFPIPGRDIGFDRPGPAT